jgi:hypothetical protein
LRGRGGAKFAEFRPRRKKKKIRWCKNQEPVPNPNGVLSSTSPMAIHAHYTKVRKTVWGSFAHLRHFPTELPNEMKRAVRQDFRSTWFDDKLRKLRADSSLAASRGRTRSFLDADRAMAKARLRRRVPRGSRFIIFVMLLAGCDRGPVPQTAPAQRPPAIRGLPVELTVKQRSTTAVPGSDEALRITIDDITAGQVIVSLADKEGSSVFAAASLKEGETAEFAFQQQKYRLTVNELDNELIGEDFATIVVSSGGNPSPALPARTSASSVEPGMKSEELKEREKIELLLAAVESAAGDVFIRNGAEHSAADAAEHLRSKWQAAGGQINTAEEFIDRIGTKSSLSGEAYRVRRADGAEIPASEYLREKLSGIERRESPVE